MFTCGTVTRPTTGANNPDGSTTTTYPNGTTVTVYPNGTMITSYPDGTTVTTYPDGTTIIFTNGNITITPSHPNPVNTDVKGAAAGGIAGGVGLIIGGIPAILISEAAATPAVVTWLSTGTLVGGGAVLAVSEHLLLLNYQASDNSIYTKR